MKKLMTIAAGLLITGSAFANSTTFHRELQRDRNVETVIYTTASFDTSSNTSSSVLKLNKDEMDRVAIRDNLKTGRLINKSYSE